MRRILITGASSGIGWSIAEKIAQQGVMIELWGRDPVRLAQISQICKERGAQTTIVTIDLSNLDDLLHQLSRVKEGGVFDDAYLAAGQSEIVPEGALVEPTETALSVAMVNYIACTMLSNTLAEKMRTGHGGRIAIIGSHNAYAPFPQAPIYASSKAGVSLYARCLQVAAIGSNVHVLLVSAGFVDTPMSRQLECPKPFMISATEAAAKVVDALEKKKTHLVLSWPLYFLTKLSNGLPHFVVSKFYAMTKVRKVK